MATALRIKNLTAEPGPGLLNDVQGKAIVTKVYCTLCTRIVEATVSLATNTIGKRRLAVVPGQKCRHCSASLDAAYVLDNLS